MVVAYHLNFSAYGFWLPNDPRGSNSEFVRTPHLKKFGAAANNRPRFSVANASHDRPKRLEAKRSLTYEPVVFNGRQALAIANGFQEYVLKSALVVCACAILPKHVHLVVLRHRVDAEHLVGQLKAAATRRLIAEGLHPFRYLNVKPLPSPWARKSTHVFLNSVREIEKKIAYVRENPLKEGKPEQRWSFVREFEAGMVAR